MPNPQIHDHAPADLYAGTGYVPGVVEPGLVQAATDILANKFSTFKARNGRNVGVQGDDGEMCWIVHSDDMFALETALTALRNRSET